MERMGHSQLATAQRYLHTLPDADDQALAAFERVRSRSRVVAPTSAGELRVTISRLPHTETTDPSVDGSLGKSP